MEKLFTAQAKASAAGRAGHVTSDDGKIDLKLSVPKGVGGDDGPGTNPEQLFAAGYSACFGGALGVVSRMKKKALGEFTIDAKVSLGKKGEAFGIEVTLAGHFPSLSKEEAKEMMEAAHQVCPYSNATRGNVDVTLEVV